MAYHVGRKDFERLVEEALRRIPRRYRRYIKNVAVMVEDLPVEEDLQPLGLKRHELLGLFRGLPHGAHDTFFSHGVFPDAIVLYQKNIENRCGSEEDLVEEIRLTLEHEIGHYFGLSEADLQQYE